MTGRVRVENVEDGSFRLCEDDGRLCHNWLPEVEDDSWFPLDMGGFEEMHDAVGFKLAIDLVRAEHRMIDETPESCPVRHHPVSTPVVEHRRIRSA